VALQVRPVAGTWAIVHVTVNITKGTPPITVYGLVYLRVLGSTVYADVKSFSDYISTNPPVSRTYDVWFSLPGSAGVTYEVIADVFVSNNYGSKELTGSAQFTT